jgi:predicted nucleotidyltransferase component of viral defense system
MEIISEDKLRVIADQQKKEIIMMEKDYFLTLFLSFIKDAEGLYFKGGTAINKIFLNHIRLSEDLDFTVTVPLDKAKKFIQGIIRENNNIFTKLDYDKAVHDFTRYLLHYRSYFSKDAVLLLDLNKRANLALKPEMAAVPNFYGLGFSVAVLNKKEIIAEKVCALINRNRARDYFDVYQIIKRGISIDMELVKKKCGAQGQEFNLAKIFSKANKIYSVWEKDIFQLTSDRTPFREIMQALKEYFRYSEVKAQMRKEKQKNAGFVKHNVP